MKDIYRIIVDDKATIQLTILHITENFGYNSIVLASPINTYFPYKVTLIYNACFKILSISTETR